MRPQSHRVGKTFSLASPEDVDNVHETYSISLKDSICDSFQKRSAAELLYMLRNDIEAMSRTIGVDSPSFHPVMPSVLMMLSC